MLTLPQQMPLSEMMPVGQQLPLKSMTPEQEGGISQCRPRYPGWHVHTPLLHAPCGTVIEHRLERSTAASGYHTVMSLSSVVAAQLPLTDQ